VKPYPRSRAQGETVREIVARILVEEISDPRLEFVTLTGVEMSPDLRHATVFVTTHGDAARYDEALAGLESAKGRIRSLLGAEVRTRHVPGLHFKMDPSVDEAFHIAAMVRHERDSGRVRDDVPEDEDEAADDDA
jgi:ribosome-binding factor A